MRIVRTLMNSIIDYAGLFPPAKLDMATTVRNYARYRQGEDAWMLGRIIVPVSRLAEFEQAADNLLVRSDRDEDFWMISALAAGLGEPGFTADLDAIDAFNERHGDGSAGAVMIDTIETRARNSDEIERGLDAVGEGLFTFVELPIEKDCRGLIAALSGRYGGAKVRTGGVTAEAYPGTEDLAGFLVSCAAADVPFKATAGLHHAMRHQSEQPACMSHGFLNVFLAAIAAWHGRASRDEVRGILDEQSPGFFRFEDDMVRFGRFEFDNDVVAQGRERFALSFGSCSFDEPLEDLRTNRLLTEAPVQ